MGEQVKVSAPLSSEKVERDGELEQRYFELLELRRRVRIAECGRVIRADPFSAEGPVEW
jgi:hypothetical protein